MNKPDSRTRRTKNNIIYTNPLFAKRVVDYFRPQFNDTDTFFEPCAGDNAFYDALPPNKDWCEISRGRNFLDWKTHIDWIFTNFPWSSETLRPLLRHGASVSNNMVHLIRMHNILGTYARQRDFLDQDHNIKEIISVKWQDAFYNKSPEGFVLIVIHTQKNYKGGSIWTNWCQ